MRLWRRRPKTVLTVLGILLLGMVLGARHLQSRGRTYTAGEKTDGLIDTLARDLPEGYPSIRFSEVSAEAGLDFVHFPTTRTNRLPEDMGSGVALGDLNADGWVDAFLVDAAHAMHEANTAPGRSRLFLGREGGRFEDVTESCGIDHRGLGMGAVTVDVDSDGDLDLFVTEFGHCRLFLNDGGAQFVDGSEAAGLNLYEGFWTGVAVSDYDLDGAMDLYVCGYVVYSEENVGRKQGSQSQYSVVIPVLLNPSSFEPERNLLLAGNGDGTFREVAEAAGTDDPKGRGLGAVFCDLNDDGLPDLYVANDVSDNALLLNRGDGTFLDSTAQALVGDYRGAMGLAAVDIDDDQDLDLFITHWVAQENALYVNYGPQAQEEATSAVPRYIDQADRYGLGAVGLRMVGWATGFFDYDNDGRRDLFVVNGSTIPVEGDPEHLAPQPSHLFWNSPAQRGYFEVGAVSGDFFNEAHVGRGGAIFDYDLDGDEDLLVMLHGERAKLLRNDGGHQKPVVRIRLRQPTGNRFAIGARIRATIGERVAFDVLGTQGSYLSQHTVGETSFGLGDAGAVDHVVVTWPDGAEDSAGPFLANSLITWTRGATPVSSPLPGRDEYDREGPASVEAQRAFFDLRGRAADARLAGDLRSAATLYQQALATWPGHTDCLYYLGNSLLELGEEHGALRSFERLVHFEPNSSKGWMQIGLLHLPGGDDSLDDLDLAEAAFLRCHAINSEESRPALQLGIVALLRGDFDTAEELCAGAARLNPKSVEALWFAGRSAFEGGDTEGALEHLRAAHRVAKGSVQDASASSEGDTRAGVALTASAGVPLHASLTRWKTLSERPIDVHSEYP